MIEFRNVYKNYGKKACIRNMSFKIDKGETVGLLGLNGTGKSTLMNMLTGYIDPTSGEILIDGKNISEEHEQICKKTGYLPEIPPLYPDMTVSEFLGFVCDIRGVREKKENIRSVIEKTGLEDVEGKMIRRLSKGYKQRAGLAAAMAGDPEILVLDEPTAGLDPKQIAGIRELISELGKDKTVLISSHILSEISALCGRVIVIKDGEKAADGAPEALTKGLTNRMILKTQGDAGKIIRETDGVVDVSFDGTSYTVETKGDIRCELFYKLAEARCPILELEYNDLENTFLNIIN